MSCYHSAVLNAPIEKVWEAIVDFHDMSWAKGVIQTCEKQGDVSGLEVGAKRLLNDVFHEELREVDVENFLFTYSIDDGPKPISKCCVANYLGTVELTPITLSDQTLIEWSTVYDQIESADTNELAEALHITDVVADFCDPIYIALLSAMQDYFKD